VRRRLRGARGARRRLASTIAGRKCEVLRLCEAIARWQWYWWRKVDGYVGRVEVEKLCGERIRGN
jgi:hypothetical protein